MSNALELLVYAFLAILRGCGGREKRYYVLDRGSSFPKDMCDFVATVLLMRAKVKCSTIQDTEGNSFNVSDYILPINFWTLIRTGEVYFNAASVERATAITKATWNADEYCSIVKEFAAHEKVNWKWEFSADDYSVSIMSPSRVNAFFQALCSQDVSVARPQMVLPTLGDFSICTDNEGGYYELDGSTFDVEVSYLSGLALPKEFGSFMRRIPRPTEEELVTWLTNTFFSEKKRLG